MTSAEGEEAAKPRQSFSKGIEGWRYLMSLWIYVFHYGSHWSSETSNVYMVHIQHMLSKLLWQVSSSWVVFSWPWPMSIGLGIITLSNNGCGSCWELVWLEFILYISSAGLWHYTGLLQKCTGDKHGLASRSVICTETNAGSTGSLGGDFGFMDFRSYSYHCIVVHKQLGPKLHLLRVSW